MKKLENLKMILATCIFVILFLIVLIKLFPNEDYFAGFTTIIVGAISLLIWATVAIIVEGITVLSENTGAQKNWQNNKIKLQQPS